MGASPAQAFLTEPSLPVMWPEGSFIGPAGDAVTRDNTLSTSDRGTVAKPVTQDRDR
ncbi:hypothetical protein KO491_10070 [Roseovarius nubinhibens]|nr:hypothetical protein [Roseovarius nubinhibens]